VGQKIWIIDDLEAEEACALPEAGRDRRRGHASDATCPARNPALAFSLSMLVWGSGQIYVREYRLGFKFLGCMILFYSAIAWLVISGESAAPMLFDTPVPAPVLIIVLVIFITSSVFFWLHSAVGAYYKAASLKTEGFRGVGNAFWPLLCSLLFPGWGQFLNGQPRKGLFFLFFGASGFSAILLCSVAPYIWPALSSRPDRFVFEIYLSAALLFLPLCILLWVVAAHDAFWTCKEPVRKRPWGTRVAFARERISTHGFGRFLIPKIKAVAISVVMLTVVVLAGKQYFPREYYQQSLQRIRVEMLNNQMHLTPRLLEKVIIFLD
jgi:TM2 domain-containing membrane protein YozV